MTLGQLNINAQKIDANKLLDEVIQQNASYFIDKLQKQLQKGQIRKGDIVRSYEYLSAKYKKRKQQMNPSAGGKVDLKNTGDFYRGMFLDKKGNEFLINSSDWKADKLKQRYSNDDIMGLSKQNTNEIAGQVIEQDYTQQLRNKLGI